MARKRRSPASDKAEPSSQPLQPVPAQSPSPVPPRSRFDPSRLNKKVLTIPLLDQISAHANDPNQLYKVIIDLNFNYSGGTKKAAERVKELFQRVTAEGNAPVSGEGTNDFKNALNRQYVFGQFRESTLLAMVDADAQPESAAVGASAGGAPSDQLLKRSDAAIHLIWPDFPIKARLTKTGSTVKADAAHLSFAATGADIVWAVMDSGIAGDHIHFKQRENLKLPAPLEHRDFTVSGSTLEKPSADEKPLEDPFGHGTHVAGIIAGETIATQGAPINAVVCEQQSGGDPSYRRLSGIQTIASMAPRCKLLSLRVLGADGGGDVSNFIAALGYVQNLNASGRHLIIHGINISAGYEFDPEWFACGQSPICVEVNRLVKSGVVVVVAAGNTGYGYEQVFQRTGSAVQTRSAGQAVSINDPGNAALAITIGSTHREMPHTYGVSYFSSKGPTGDGRCKPDLVAPGEKVLSCAAGELQTRCKNGLNDGGPCDFAEDSGTSMAAPHVSGVIAAFLSIRPEYISQPEEVKRIFMASATDLGRERYFQGSGLVDLMRAIQSV